MNHPSKIKWSIQLIIMAILLVSCDLIAQDKSSNFEFEAQSLCIDNNEVCILGDVNNDGLDDIVAGRNWYPAPDFVPRPLRALAIHPPDYARNNGEYLWDVNGDSWLDIITTGWGEKRLLWYENPGEIGLQKGLPWAVHTLAEIGHGDGEIASFEDLDGDGIPEYIINSYVKDNPFRVFRFDESGLKMLPAKIGPRNSHGVGFGDVNGDGLKDILIDEGWYEQPRDQIWDQTWVWHRDWNRAGGSCPMQIIDLNADGLNDVIWGRGHDYGLFWYEQLPGQKWKSHLIDSTWSQAHALKWTDLDGDREPELIAGKRIFAHSGKDPGSSDTANIYVYQWNRHQQTFSRSTITSEKIGTGLFIRTSDLNADNLIDIVVAGKTGTYILWQK